MAAAQAMVETYDSATRLAALRSAVLTDEDGAAPAPRLADVDLAAN